MGYVCIASIVRVLEGLSAADLVSPKRVAQAEWTGEKMTDRHSVRQAGAVDEQSARDDVRLSAPLKQMAALIRRCSKKEGLKGLRLILDLSS